MALLNFRRYWNVLLAVVVLCASCGGGTTTAPDPSGNGDQSQQETNQTPPATTSDVFEMLPAIPWDDDGEIRAASEAGSNSRVVLGSEYLLKHNAEVDGTSLVLTGRGEDEAGDGPPIAYGLYKISGLTGKHPLSLNVECLPAGLGHHYFVGIADYTDGRWLRFGPIEIPEYEIDLRGSEHRFVSRLGNLYFVIVAPPEHSATHSQSTLLLAAENPPHPPGAPHGLVATDGVYEHKVVIEWYHGEGADFYKLFRALAGDENNADDSGDWQMIAELEGNRYEDSAVDPGVLYKYKAKAFNENGHSGFSNIDTGYAGELGGGDPPGRPLELQASDGTHEGGVLVEWWGGDGADHFLVFRKVAETEQEWTLIGDPTGHELFDNTAEQGVVYAYKAKAVNEYGHSDFSNIDTGYWGESGGNPPGHPFNLQASDGEFENHVLLTWDGGEGAGWFRIERRDADPLTEWMFIGESEVKEFIDDDVIPGKLYKYHVQAVNEFGASEWCEPDSGYAGTMGGDPPGKPIELQASDGTHENGVLIEWWGGEGADYFLVFRKVAESEDEWLLIGDPTGHELFDESAEPGVIYAYKAKAVNGYGHSDFSNIDTGYRASAPPPVNCVIEGTVMHGENPVSCAVTLLTRGEAPQTAETGPDGGFRFGELTPGLYIVYPQHHEFLFEPHYMVFNLTAENHIGIASFSAFVPDITQRAFGFVYGIEETETGLHVAPMAGVKVIAWQESSGYESFVFTNEDGYYMFSDLPEGVVLFKPVKEGYYFEPSVHDANIGANIPPALNFRGFVVP